MPLTDRLEAKWIDSFVEVFRLFGVQPGDACAVLSETLSRPSLVQLSELALARLGGRWFHVVLPTPRQSAPVPVRSTGASDAIGRLPPVISALAGSVFIADCTVESLQHAVELPEILKGGARVLVVSNEHPEILERTAPRAEDEAEVRDAMRRLKGARAMRVMSDAGSDLAVSLAGARIGGVWGFTAKPGSLSHWPAGLVLASSSPAFGKPGGDWQRGFLQSRFAPLDAGLGMAGLAAQLVPAMVAPGTAPAVIARAQTMMAGVPEATYRRAMTALVAFDRRANLPHIAVPTLLITGEHDATAAPELSRRMAERIPGALCKVVPAAGHLLNREQPAAFNTALRSHLSACAPAR